MNRARLWTLFVSSLGLAALAAVITITHAIHGRWLLCAGAVGAWALAAGVAASTFAELLRGTR